MSGSGMGEERQSGRANVEAQYRAVRTGVGLFDLAGNGLLRVTGKNAVPFLHGLVSNEVRSLEVGSGVLAAFPNLQGKLVALARIYQLETGVLLEVEATNHEKVLRNLSRFVPAGEFWIEDLSETWAGLALEGPAVERLLSEVAEGWAAAPVAEEEPAVRRLVITRIDGVEVWAAAHRRCGEPGYDLFLPREAIEGLRERLLGMDVPFPVEEIDREVFEMVRIEAGVPREGQDAGEEYILLETGLDEAISYQKGCYLGQEVIARIHWRGQPARQLRGVLPEATGAPPIGTELYATDGSLAGRRIGQITSATWSLGLGRPIALGYVHRYYLTPGTTVELKQGETTLGRGEVTDLPFSVDRKG